MGFGIVAAKQKSDTNKGVRMGSHYRHNGWFRNTLLACSVLIISSFASVSFGDVIPAKKSAWEQLEIRQAPWRPIGGSLELTGGKWTNGKNDGNMIWSRDRFDHTGKDVFIRFKVEDGGAYMGIWTHPRPLPMPIYTTRNTHQGSILIEENTWYFQRTRVDADGNWQQVLSKGSFDISGGKPVFKKEGRLSRDLREKIEETRLLVGFADNYAGVAAKMWVADVFYQPIGAEVSESFASVPGAEALEADARYQSRKKKLRELYGAGFWDPALQAALEGLNEDPGRWFYNAFPAQIIQQGIEKQELEIADWGKAALARLSTLEDYRGDTDPVHSMLFAYFDYGVGAVAAKRYSMAEIALAKLKNLTPTSLMGDTASREYQQIHFLSALISASKGDVRTAFNDLIAADIKGVHKQLGLYMKFASAKIWEPLWKEEGKFKFITGFNDRDMSKLFIEQRRKLKYKMPQAYPDLTGRIIPPPGQAVNKSPAAPQPVPASDSGTDAKKPKIKLLD